MASLAYSPVLNLSCPWSCGGTPLWLVSIVGSSSTERVVPNPAAPVGDLAARGSGAGSAGAGFCGVGGRAFLPSRAIGWSSFHAFVLHLLPQGLCLLAGVRHSGRRGLACSASSCHHRGY